MELITWSTSSLTSSARVVRRWTIKLRVELIDVYSWNRTFCQDWTQRRWCGGRQDEKHGWTDLWKWHRIKMATGHIVITSVIIILHQVTPCRVTEFHQHICRKLVSTKNVTFCHFLHSFCQLFEDDHLLAWSSQFLTVIWEWPSFGMFLNIVLPSFGSDSYLRRVESGTSMAVVQHSYFGLV